MEPVTASYNQATHLLHCRHCIGRNCKDYQMLCIPLKKTKSGKLKVKVFGDRYWKDRRHVEQIRYVNSDRVRPIDK